MTQSNWMKYLRDLAAKQIKDADEDAGKYKEIESFFNSQKE